MELTGKITNISMNYLSPKYEVTLAVNEAEKLTAGYENLKDVELLDIKINKHKKRRSLDANAYFHVLVGKLADKLNISKAKCKNIILGRYGQPMTLENGEIAIIKTNVPVEQMIESEFAHCCPVKETKEKGADIVFYKLIRGSSTYDTREMSVLIDGIVYECKEQLIETMTPEELQQMINKWCGKRK